MSAFSDTPRDSSMPYAMLAIRVGIHRLHSKFRALFGHGVPFVYERGVGSSSARFGGPEFDLDHHGKMMPWEREQLTTLQPGQGNYQAGSPVMAEAWLRTVFHWAEDTELTQAMQTDLSDQAFINKWLGLLQRGAQSHHDKHLAKDGPFNQLLLDLPHVDWVLNWARYGSRAKPWRDLKGLDKAICANERAITVAHVSSAINLQIHTVFPLLTVMKAVLGKMNDRAFETKLATLQQEIKQHPLLKEIFDKCYELVYLSDTALFEYLLEDKAFPDKHDRELKRLIKGIKSAQAYLERIVGPRHEQSRT